MKSIQLLGLLVAAGAFGAVAGGTVGALTQPVGDDTNSVVLERLDEIARSVDTLIKRVRQKIEGDSSDPRLVLTVWGTGYKFSDESTSD